jgi:uncharacterized protein (DUF1778 family)
MAKEKADAKSRMIKIAVTADDHVRLRLAAAMTDQAISEFCREVVLERARELTKEIKLPGKTNKAGPHKE